jgi:DEAD/DEAH box helicase domain-containing protein
MIPSVVASEVRASIEDFLKTEFRPASPGFEGLMQRFLATPEAVFKGPYLSVGLPFRPGSTGADYFPDVPMAFPPHRHQEQAFARLKSPYYQSTLVATGTGSGKTECFMLPILNHSPYLNFGKNSAEKCAYQIAMTQFIKLLYLIV